MIATAQLRFVEVSYQDHHKGWTARKHASEKSECLNWCVGFVVFEDADWIRVCNQQTDVGDVCEEWAVTVIRKSDIIEIKELDLREPS